MVRRLIRNQLPRKGLRVRVPCPPLNASPDDVRACVVSWDANYLPAEGDENRTALHRRYTSQQIFVSGFLLRRAAAADRLGQIGQNGNHFVRLPAGLYDVGRTCFVLTITTA